MQLSRMTPLAGFFLAAVLSAPAGAVKTATPGANTAIPGMVNYVEGQASMGAQNLTSKSIGRAELQSGQSLQTQKGMAEVLLTPGVFLRLGNDTSVKMISPSLVNTEVQVSRGHAMIEADRVHKANHIYVDQDGTTVRLLKNGLYDFDADQGLFRVFKGQALVQEGDRRVKVKGGHEVSLNSNVKLKAQGFKQKAEEGDLYRFSRLRSDYLAEANAQATVYVTNGWTAGPGWWWDPWFHGYTFIPAGGGFYSPFGWGFYSPVAGYPYGGPYWGWIGPYHFLHRPPPYGYRPWSGTLHARSFPHGPAVGMLRGTHRG